MITASDELVEKPILGGWLRVRSAPGFQTPRRRAEKGVNNPAIQFAAPVAPVPEANAWALFASAALAAIGLYRRRARLSA